VPTSINKQIIEGYRLSPQQEHLWLLQQNGHNLPYRAQCAVMMEGKLEPEVLSAALANVIGRHGILRTTYHCLPKTEVPVQVINDGWRPVIPCHDLSGLDELQQEAVTASLYRELRRQGVDFEQGPPVQLSLVKLSPTGHKLIISLPALSSDRAGLRNLLREISRSYAVCLGQEELADEPVQYIAISEWLNELLETEEAGTGRDYWRKFDLSDCFTSRLPFHNRPSSEAGFEPCSKRVALSPELVTRIEAITAAHHVSVAVFMMACWQTLLWKHTKLSDLTIGIACDGRTDVDLEGLPGLLTKFVPLQVHLEPALPFTELLNQTKRSRQDGLEWQELYSWKSVFRVGESVSREPFFSLCFEHEEESARISAGGVHFAIVDQDVCIDRFELKLLCSRHDRLMAEFHYDSDLFTAEAIACLIDQFQQLVASVANDPEAGVGQVNLLSESQRQQLLTC
jgi:hypothetical protein